MFTTAFLMKPWQKLSVLVLYAKGKEVFCFRSDNKRTNSKTFCFDLLVFGLNRNVLRTLPQTISRPYKIALLCPKIVGPKRKRSACGKNVWDKIKNFCFHSDSQRTKSKRFAFVPIIRFDIEKRLCFRFDIGDITSYDLQQTGKAKNQLQN
jgi:hypothetical protein